MTQSFVIDGQRIDVEQGYSHVDGVYYQLLRAATGEQIAATSYRGLRVEAGVEFAPAALSAGLASVLGRQR